MSRTPPFAARAAAQVVPPCRRNPDAWLINIAAGYTRAAEAIRQAVAGCWRCKAVTPKAYASCKDLPATMLSPRTIVAGYVVTSAQKLVDPDRYITVTLRNLKPLPGDVLDAMERDNAAV